MSRRTQKSVRASCDRLWSQLVRARAGRCEWCGRTGRLEAHHTYGRTDHRLRFEPRNGVCLCFTCHMRAEGFPILFTRWFEEARPDDAEFLAVEHRVGPIRRTMAEYLSLEADLTAALKATYERAA